MRVLLVEDSPDDAELILRALRRGGMDVEPRRVETRAQMEAALREAGWDAILSDYSLPGFSGLDALDVLHESGLDLPFILVSGAVGEEIAVDAMKAGAHDYIRKENLRRLVPAVQRELREAAIRRARKSDEHARTFLAHAGAILGASLDAQRLADTVAHLVAPELADVCVLFTGDGGPSLAVAGADGAAIGLDRVRALIAEETRVLDAASSDLVRALGGRAALTVPLRARGRTLGGLLLVASRPDRYGASERELVEELARRVALALDNALLYQAAQEAIRVREEFLSVASHELKTPLTSVHLLAQSLYRNARNFASEEPRLRMEKLLKQLDRLTRLCDDLLNVSRLRTGQLQLEVRETDLSALLDDSIEQLREMAERAGCAVHLQTPPSLPARCDPARVEQVFVNLLSNAFKYGAGRPVDVELAARDGHVTFQVRDHGIGLKPGDQERVFRRFERAVSPHHYGGLGLGLYIAAQIARAHGGSISVDSAPGQGATFRVQLPLSPG